MESPERIRSQFEELIGKGEALKGNFARGISSIQSQIDSDLKSLLQKFEASLGVARKKIDVLLEKEVQQFKMNTDKFMTKAEAGLKNCISGSIEKKQTSETPDLARELNFLSEFESKLRVQSQQIPHYISYSDESHSFHQVVQIMNKSFKLFEEHFEDLLKVSPLKDLSSEKYLSFNESEISDDRAHLLMKGKAKNVKLEFIKEVKPEHSGPLNSITVLTEDIMITSSIDRTIRLYSLSLNKVLLVLENFKFSPMTLFLIKSHSARRKTVPGGSLVLPQKKMNCLSGSKAPDAERTNECTLLASGGGDYDSNIYIWNLRTGKKVQTLPGHNRHITTINQLPDKNILVSGSYDAKIFLWNLNKAEPVMILTKHSFWIFNIKVMKCKTRMASCGWDRVVYIWKIIYDDEVDDKFVFKDIKVETMLQETYEISMLNTLRNNTNIIISSNIGRAVSIWDVSTSSCLKQITIEKGFANELLILEMQDQKEFFILATSIDDNSVRIYSSESGLEVFSIERETLNLNAYNLNPKMQFFKFPNGDFGIVTVNHSQANPCFYVWKLILE